MERFGRLFQCLAGSAKRYAFLGPGHHFIQTGLAVRWGAECAVRHTAVCICQPTVDRDRREHRHGGHRSRFCRGLRGRRGCRLRGWCCGGRRRCCWGRCCGCAFRWCRCAGGKHSKDERQGKQFLFHKEPLLRADTESAPTNWDCAEFLRNRRMRASALQITRELVYFFFNCSSSPARGVT